MMKRYSHYGYGSSLLPECPSIDFLAGIDLNSNSLTAMEMSPASLPIRIMRILFRGSGLICGVTCCLLEYFLRRCAGRLSEQARTEILHRWSQWTLARMHVTVAVSGAPPNGGLIAGNHLSYLDILVYSAVAPCAFVSKREVRNWPAVGWIATLAGSIYVDRTHRAGTHTIQPEIQAALAKGLRLVLFPEGTSTDGSGLLRFHSSLFQPAVDLQVPIFAAYLTYTVPDGVAGTDACWWGDMALFPHITKLLGKHSVTATVKFAAESFRFVSAATVLLNA